MRLQDKVAIVVGGGAGMGRAVAQAFSREGARVLVADVDEATGSSCARAIVDSGGEAVFVHTDITDAAQVESMAAAAVDRYGRIDVLHVNAGIQSRWEDKRAHELSDEFWQRTMDVNLRGSWLCSKYVIPQMLVQGGGSIILVGSPTGYLGCAPGYTAYSTSKGGIIGLVRIMAVDYARDGIRVNSIVPGTMDTPMIEEFTSDPEVAQQLAEAIPLGRIGQPSEITGLAVFLASDESSFCTGGFYPADGGQAAI